MKSVFSSHVDAVKYDTVTRRLTVRWGTGRTSVYDGVPPEVGRDVVAAPSIGEALHRAVRGVYEHRYLEGEEQ